GPELGRSELAPVPGTGKLVIAHVSCVELCPLVRAEPGPSHEAIDISAQQQLEGAELRVSRLALGDVGELRTQGPRLRRQQHVGPEVIGIDTARAVGGEHYAALERLS